MKRILFVMPSLDSGGAEKSLVNLLNIIDLNKYKIDLLLLKKEGLFLKQIPKDINILDTDMKLKYAYKIDKETFTTLFGLKYGFLRLASTFICKILYKEKARQQRWVRYYKKYLPRLNEKYDIAVGFLEGDASYYVIDKVTANKKILWIHNDFNEIKQTEEKSVYEEYFCKANNIVSISDKCVQILVQNFPHLENKILYLPNLTSSSLLKKMAVEYKVDEFRKDEFNILSIGRLTKQKGYDLAIEALDILKNKYSNVHWWIIGAGELEKQLKEQVKCKGLEKYITFLGLKENPYPYIKECDLLVQSSRWEGKSVVLDEAKILAKPILATNYSTITDQLITEVEGLIVDMNAQSISDGIIYLIEHEQIYNKIKCYLENHEFGNEDDIKKYYLLFDNNR